MKLSIFYQHLVEAVKQSGLPMEEILRRVRAMGIEYAEIDYRDVANDDKVFRLLQDADIQISSIYGYYSFEKGQSGKDGYAHADRAKELNCSRIMIIPGFYSGKDDEAERELMLAAVRDMCSYAEKQGITPTMEDYDDCMSPIATAEQQLWFIERVPQLKATLDTGNYLYSGKDEWQAYELLKDHIAHVHLKDRALEEKPGCDGKRCPDGKLLYPAAVGSGCIQMKKIIDALENSGYQGIYTIEHFGADDHLLYMEQSARWLLQQAR